MTPGTPRDSGQRAHRDSAGLKVRLRLSGLPPQHVMQRLHRPSLAHGVADVLKQPLGVRLQHVQLRQPAGVAAQLVELPQRDDLGGQLLAARPTDAERQVLLHRRVQRLQVMEEARPHRCDTDAAFAVSGLVQEGGGLTVMQASVDS